MKSEIVKKPDELIKMRGELSEAELKLSTYLISILREDINIYEISVKSYLEQFDKNLGDFDYLYEVALNLTRKQFKMVDRFKKRFEIYNFLAGVKYYNGILKVEFSSMLLDYLILIKNKYLKYKIRNIMVLTSKYSIRLYEILKNELEMRKRQKRESEFELNLDELRELLSIPRSYKYKDIRVHILEKSQKDFEKTDINFEFEPIKKGRKVVAIRFKVIDKSKKYKQKIQPYRKEDNFRIWRQEILKRGNIFIKLDDKVFELKDKFLFEDNELLNKEEAFSIWQELYKNRDRIEFLKKEEFKREISNNLREKILKVFKGKEFKSIPILREGNLEYVDAVLINIKDFKDIDNFKAIFRSDNGKFFAMNLSLDKLKGLLR